MHQKRCHGGPEIMHHICQLCPKQFTSLRALKNHQVAHSPFGCFYCPSKFKYQASFWKHMKRVHPSMTSFSQETPTFKIAGNTCELCGFEPKTKNKSRERQDHLAMKHYRERIQADLTASTNFSCPLCEYIGKDKQTIYRHYTGKHKVVEQYLAQDIEAGRVETLAQKQAKLAAVEVASNNVTNNVTTVSEALVSNLNAESLKTLPSFEATYTTENTSLSSGLDLSLHGLVDPETGHRIDLNELLDGTDGVETGTITSSDPGSTSSDHIMQVDGTTVMRVKYFFFAASI